MKLDLIVLDYVAWNRGVPEQLIVTVLIKKVLL